MGWTCAAAAKLSSAFPSSPLPPAQSQQHQGLEIARMIFSLPSRTAAEALYLRSLNSFAACSPGGRNQEKRCRKGGRTSHTASIQARRFLTQSFSKTRTDVAPLFGPTLVIDIVRVLPSGEIFRIVFPVTVPSRL